MIVSISSKVSLQYQSMLPHCSLAILGGSQLQAILGLLFRYMVNSNNAGSMGETRLNVYRCGRGQDSQDSDDWQHDLSFMHLNIQMINHVY